MSGDWIIDPQERTVRLALEAIQKRSADSDARASAGSAAGRAWRRRVALIKEVLERVQSSRIS